MFSKRKLSTLPVVVNPADLRKRTKIVVIDDQASSWEPFKRLQNDGYDIEYWKKVQSLERLERGDFDIIILDIVGVAKEYGSDGFGIAKVLKQANPAQIIIAISGHSYRLDKGASLVLFDDYLSKPTTPLKCKMAIDNTLSKMTPAHYWNAASEMLRNAGLGGSEIARIERRLTDGISGCDINKLKKVFETAKVGVELLERLGKIAYRIGVLCGL